MLNSKMITGQHGQRKQGTGGCVLSVAWEVASQDIDLVECEREEDVGLGVVEREVRDREDEVLPERQR